MSDGNRRAEFSKLTPPSKRNAQGTVILAYRLSDLEKLWCTKLPGPRRRK